VNFGRGGVVANSVLVKAGVGGRVCLFSLSRAHLVVDVNGSFPVGAGFDGVVPARLLDTRPGGPTVDGRFSGGGVRAAGSVTELQVGGRGGVPVSVGAVSLNVTVVGPEAAGFVTVYPCGERRPTASNVNFGRGGVVANSVLVKAGVGGRVCLFSLSRAHLVVDVNGSFPSAIG
jgi:hypothetical protein